MFRRMAVFVLTMVVSAPVGAAAQTTFRRGWFDVNLGGAAPASSSFDMSAAFDDGSGEDTRALATHRLGSGASFDFGGGVLITPVFGLGVSFTGTAHQRQADIEIEVPHPLFFNAFARDASSTEGDLLRSEGGFHIQLMVVAVDRGSVRVRVFGGPSYMRVEQEAVDLVAFDQSFGIFVPTNSVRITEYDTREVEGRGWGSHVGADVSWFVSNVVGLGAFVRYTGATVEIENTLGSGRVDVKAGGVQVGGGLRLRF